jgi:fumarate hydratase class II
VIGNDSVVISGEMYGSILDLNMSKPIMIVNVLESIEILVGGINSFISNCLIGLKANTEQINTNLDQMLMIVTNLSPIIGYDKCSEIAQRAHKEGKTCKVVIKEMGLKIDNLDELLDPKKMVCISFDI